MLVELLIRVEARESMKLVGTILALAGLAVRVALLLWDRAQ